MCVPDALCFAQHTKLAPPLSKKNTPKNQSNGASATIKAVGSSAQIVKPNIVCGKGLMQDINAVLLPLAVPAPRTGDDRR